MRSIKSFILLYFIIFSQGIYAQKKSASSPFFFIQITDPQFGFLDANKGFEKESILYQRAVDEVNRLKPDFVVITGDFVNNGSDSLQWKEFERITTTFDQSIPIYYSPGNHDIGQIPTQKRIDAYKASYGDDKFSFKYKKNWFIGFNSCIIKADLPEMEHEQFVWLEKELKKTKKAKNIVLFCHHPFFTKEPDEPETYSNIGVEKRKRYLELFDKHKVNAVFAGHYHNNAYGKYGNMNMVTTSAVGKPLGKAPSGIRIVVVGQDVSSIYYGLDDIPESIDYTIKGHQ